MNEAPTNDYEAHIRRASATLGVGAVERELTGQQTDAVEIALYVNGRMVHTKTDSAMVQRIMALLTGLEG